MIELLVLGALAFAALIVVGVLMTVFSIAGWFLWLPFRILGWMFKLVGVLIALPFILIACLLGGFGVLLGTGFMLLPVLPILAFGGLMWWLFRTRPAHSQARVS